MLRFPRPRLNKACRGMALLPFVAGCHFLGPDYHTPAMDIPATWRATPAHAAQAWPAEDWWHGFGSPELDQLIATARIHNNDLLAAIARVRQADAQARISGSPLLPVVTGTGNDSYQRIGSGSRGKSSGVGISTGVGNSTIVTTSDSSTYIDSRSYRLTASVTYEVDFWGKNRATAEAAEASALATRYDQDTVALTVVSSVATTWFQVLAYADRLHAAERNLHDTAQTLEVLRARLQAGTVSMLDVTQQETLVAQQRANIPNLRSQMEQQLIALGLLTGLPPERIMAQPGTLFALKAPPVTPGLPSELLIRRPDVAYAEALLVSQNGSIRAARAAFFPTVQLTGAMGWQSLVLASLFGPGTVLTTAVGSIAQTIFDNGNLRGQLEQTKGRNDELIADYRKAVLQAFTDVDTALVAYRFASEQEDLAGTAAQSAQRASDIARAQVAVGTADVTTVLSAENTLFTAQDTLAQVRLVRFQALVNLYKALGGGWKIPSVDPTPRHSLVGLTTPASEDLYTPPGLVRTKTQETK